MKNLKDYKLFTVGPAQMYKNTLNVRGQNVPYFRTSEFSEMMLDSCRLLKKFENTEDEAEVIVLTASGSGAMEATVINCFDNNDKLLVICGGTFGERFVKICEIHNIPHEIIRLKDDETLTLKHFELFSGKNFTGVLVNIDETSTGQLYDIEIIHKFCKENNLYLVVDAISSFLCDPYDMKKYSIDATIISSQKGLCLAPGLSLITLSRRMIEKIKNVQSSTLYFDFKDYIANIKRGQTPFTPAVGICFELNDMLNMIDKQGVENRIAEVKGRCDYFRKLIKNMPVNLLPFPLSNAVTPLRFEKDIAKELFEYLKNDKSIVVNPSGGELGKRSIRVAHMGNLSFTDYDMLVQEIKNFLEKTI